MRLEWRALEYTNYFPCPGEEIFVSLGFCKLFIHPSSSKFMHVPLHVALVVHNVHQKVIWKPKFIQMLFTDKQGIIIYVL